MVHIVRRNTSTMAAERKVYIAGQGLVPVSKKQAFSLRMAGAKSISAALKDAGLEKSAIGALYAGNMLAGQLSHQQHIAVLLATEAGLSGVEATTVEACSGSGGAALRLGYMSILSGIHETVIVAGIEAMTHVDPTDVTRGLATASDWEAEGGKGETFVSLNGILMDLYIKKYGVDRESFYPFSANAHQNAMTSPHALLKKVATADDYKKSKVNDRLRPINWLTGPHHIFCFISSLSCKIANYIRLPQLVRPPIRVLDSCPISDGAAAVILTSDPALADLAGRGCRVELAGSACATDILAVRARPDPLQLQASAASFSQAARAAGVAMGDVDIFELHDAYTIMACLAVESVGLARPGEGTSFAAAGEIGLRGSAPMSTFGGLKARGHAVGATGVYQVR